MYPSPFGELSVTAFLRDYWQQQPLLVRQAFPGFQTPVSPEELAGLACEEEVESRLVLETGGLAPWELRHGPFVEEDFTTLPDSHWTLLVQDMEKHLPQLRELFQPFRFLPHGRVDDLMISYAAPGGSVGPHTDQYDVFLIQGSGRRHWSIRVADEGDPRLIDGLDLRILARFEPDRTWLLEPGDMLYLPPGVPHHGVADGPCMTFSVGFRAPARRELLMAVLEEIAEHCNEKLRFTDPQRRPSEDPARIDAEALQQARDLVRQALDDDTLIDRCFARLLTEPKPHCHPEVPAEPPTTASLITAVQAGARLYTSPFSRFAWYRDGNDRAMLAVDGEIYPLPAECETLASILEADRALEPARIKQLLESTAATELLTELTDLGALIVEEPV